LELRKQFAGPCARDPGYLGGELDPRRSRQARGGLAQRPCGRRERREAARDEARRALRASFLETAQSGRPGPQPGAPEVLDQLADEKRVAARPRSQRGREAGWRILAERVLRQLLHRLFADRRRSHERGDAPEIVGVRSAPLPPDLRLVGGDQEQDRQVPTAAREIYDEAQRVGVRPLEVVQRDEERSLPRELRERRRQAEQRGVDGFRRGARTAESKDRRR